MSRCPSITGKGEPCKGFVHPSKEYCPAHDPSRVDARRQAASKAGRSKAGSELHSIKQKLIQLADDLLDNKAHRGNAAVAVTALGTAIKCVEAETKVRELDESRLVETRLKVTEQAELIQRLEELEERLTSETEGSSSSRSPWGA